MEFLAPVILVFILLSALLGVAMLAGIIWTIIRLVQNRRTGRPSPKIYYLWAPSLVLLITAPFAYFRWTEPKIDRVDISSPSLAPFHSMYSFPYAQYGFSPIPPHAIVQIDKFTGAMAATAGCDVMVHIDSKSYRTLSFKRVGANYQLIGLEEEWAGPHQYATPDAGPANESIQIHYETHLGFRQSPVASVHYTYSGQDPRLAGKGALSLQDVQPIINEWASH